MDNNPVPVLSTCYLSAIMRDVQAVNPQVRLNTVQLVAMFVQTWPSTSLGFNGIGGQAFTEAYTTVIGCFNSRTFCVYFGGRLAYSLVNPTALFYEDLERRDLAPVSRAGAYRRKEKTDVE